MFYHLGKFATRYRWLIMGFWYVTSLYTDFPKAVLVVAVVTYIVPLKKAADMSS